MYTPDAGAPRQRNGSARRVEATACPTFSTKMFSQAQLAATRSPTRSRRPGRPRLGVQPAQFGHHPFGAMLNIAVRPRHRLRPPSPAR
jgi:hypothetical protein